MLGVKMVFPGPHLHPEDLLELMAQEAPSYVLGVPTIWMSMAQLLEADPQKYKLPQGVRMLVGGAAMPEALIRTYAKHGAAVTHGWGMTEMSPLGTVSYLKPELQEVSADEKFARYATAGVPVPLCAIRLIGHDGSEQPWDGTSVGEIQVRGPFITGSYHEVPPEPEKFTADGWLRTGDVAMMTADGFFKIVDRKKDMILVSGFNVYPNEIEDVIAHHPKVREVAVIGVPDDKSTEAVKVFIARSDPSLTEEEVRAFCAEELTGYKRPKHIEFRDELPKSNVGKILRRELRDEELAKQKA
jgi:fatty-acyl-CoA synthase